MKKFLSIALATASVAACLSFVGCNGGEAIVNYTLSEDGTYYIVSSVSGNKNALTEYEIPSTYSAEEGGAQLPVTTIADRAFFQCVNLSKLTLPDTLTTIGDRAFAMCGMTYIDIPDSVETIGPSAFRMCTNLKKVVIPSSVTGIGDSAFMGCTALQRAEVYANITDMKAGTFFTTANISAGEIYTQSSITEIVLPASLEKIAKSAIGGGTLITLTDIYFMGSEEEWDNLYFYEYEEKESDKEGEEPEYEEVRVTKESCIRSSTYIHFNYVPET